MLHIRSAVLACIDVLRPASAGQHVAADRPYHFSTESFMKSRIPERNWRMALGRVPHAWSRNHWIISHRLGPQGQQPQDGSWAPAADAHYHYVPRSPATAAARVGPTRRQRAAESNWENEGGATQSPVLAPGHGKHEE